MQKLTTLSPKGDDIISYELSKQEITILEAALKKAQDYADEAPATPGISTIDYDRIQEIRSNEMFDEMMEAIPDFIHDGDL
jgi:hypothetical protein